MIHKFTAKNFYSFKDTVEVNFQVNDHAPDTQGYVNDATMRVSKLMSVVGANASGKTNSLKVLPFLQYFIVASFNLKPDEEIPFLPYLFTTNKDIRSELLVVFSCNGSTYEYTLELNQKQVFAEKLREFNKNTNQFSTLFSRVWNKQEDSYVYKLDKFIAEKTIKTIVQKRKNASLLSIAVQFGHKLSQDIATYWQALESNVIEFGKHDHGEFITEAAQFYYENPEAKLKIESLLAKYDLGLTKLDVEKRKQEARSGKEIYYYVPIGYHKGENKDYSLPFIYESGGTKCLFTLLRQIIAVLKSGSIAVLDEFDADLHPQMLPELLELFLSEEFNPKNAQLLFSTHHHEILNKLDKYQITIVEKNQTDGTSETWRLDELNVRSDDNYYAKYIAGAYGGVPNL